MKKIIIAAVIIIVAIIIGILAIHSYDSEDDSVITVGLILNGNINDKSWSQSHYEGMTETADELGINLIYRESVAEADLVKVVDELVEEGSKVIICNYSVMASIFQRQQQSIPIFIFIMLQV